MACKSVSSDVHGYVLGENVYQDGIVNLKVDVCWCNKRGCYSSISSE